MVDISTVHGIINQLITYKAPPCGDVRPCGFVSHEITSPLDIKEARRMALRFMEFPSSLNFAEYCPGMLALVHASDLGRMPSDLCHFKASAAELIQELFLWQLQSRYAYYGGNTWKLTDTFSIARSLCVGYMILWSMSCNWLNQQGDLWFLWHQAISKSHGSKAMDLTGMDHFQVGTPNLNGVQTTHQYKTWRNSVRFPGKVWSFDPFDHLEAMGTHESHSLHKENTLWLWLT